MPRNSTQSPNGRPFVELPSDIVENVSVLSEACFDSGAVGEYSRNIVRLGHNFVAAQVDGALAFAPSRFAGYLNNSPKAHDADEGKHGSKTDQAISAVLGVPPAASQRMERAFEEFCARIGIAPSAWQRKYWQMEGQFELSGREDDDVRDVADLMKRKRSIGPTKLKRLVDARRGQGAYRAALLQRFGRKCAVSGCGIQQILRASHCKPWRSCDDHERLDDANGLLLEARLDALFDRFLISFGREGDMIVSRRISQAERTRLGLSGARLRQRPDNPQWEYLAHHLRTFQDREG